MALRTVKPRLNHHEILNNRCNMQALKAGIKKQFRDHQKTLRQKAVNEYRRLDEREPSIKSRLEEIRANLSKGFDSDHEDYLNVIFKEVEWELYQEELQRQAEEYEQDLNKEVDALTQNLEYCIVCGAMEIKTKEKKLICDECVRGIFDS